MTKKIVKPRKVKPKPIRCDECGGACIDWVEIGIMVVCTNCLDYMDPAILKDDD